MCLMQSFKNAGTSCSSFWILLSKEGDLSEISAGYAIVRLIASAGLYSAAETLRVMCDGALDLPSKLKDLDLSTI